MKFHTAIAALMSFTNEAQGLDFLPKELVKSFVLLLSPFAPHIGEELWEKLGASNTLAYEPWPTYSEELAAQERTTYARQGNGKLRDTLEVEVGTTESAVLALVHEHPKVKPMIAGKEVQRTIFVANRLVNIVLAK